jgi:Tfp pilus assembly protein PilP
MAKKRLSNLHKFFIVAGVLIVAQVIFIFLYAGDQSGGSPKDAIKSQIKNSDPKKQISFAVLDYKKRNGELPKSLQSLVPKYFDSIPIDPETKKPFTYSVSVDGKKFFIGEKKSSSDLGIDGSQPIKNALEIINADAINARPPYNPEGKRDPFRPYDPEPAKGVSLDKAPLELYPLDDLKVTAIVEVGGEPAANIQIPTGSGYLIKKGAKIGQNGGEVIEILSDRVVVLETSKDFSGEEKTRQRELIINRSGTSNNRQRK